MTEITKKNKYITFITYGIILTAIVDYSANLHFIVYLVLFLISSSIVGYTFYFREKNNKKIFVIRSKYLVVIIPFLFISLLAYKTYITSINSRNFLGEDVWRITEISIDDKKIDIDESEFCTSVKFFKYRILSSKGEAGIYQCKYILGNKDRMKFASANIRFVPRGINVFEYDDYPICKDLISSYNINLLSKFRYELQDNKLKIRQKGLTMILER